MIINILKFFFWGTLAILGYSGSSFCANQMTISRYLVAWEALGYVCAGGALFASLAAVFVLFPLKNSLR